MYRQANWESESASGKFVRARCFPQEADRRQPVCGSPGRRTLLALQLKSAADEITNGCSDWPTSYGRLFLKFRQPNSEWTPVGSGSHRCKDASLPWNRIKSDPCRTTAVLLASGLMI